MKARYTGDPRYRSRPDKANDPETMVYHGKTFPKGEWVTIDDKKEAGWVEQHGDKLNGSSHFEVDNEPAQPGLDPYKEDADWKKRQAEEQKRKEEQAAREEAVPGHAPDPGPVKDVGQEDVTPPTAGPEGNPMTQGFGSVDSPTESPSRNPEKRQNLIREREAALAQAPEPSKSSKSGDASAKSAKSTAKPAAKPAAKTPVSADRSFKGETAQGDTFKGETYKAESK